MIRCSVQKEHKTSLYIRGSRIPAKSTSHGIAFTDEEWSRKLIPNLCFFCLKTGRGSKVQGAGLRVLA